MTQDDQVAPSDEPVGYDGFGAPIYDHAMPPPLEPSDKWMSIKDIQPYIDAIDNFTVQLIQICWMHDEDWPCPLAERPIPERGQE